PHRPTALPIEQVVDRVSVPGRRAVGVGVVQPGCPLVTLVVLLQKSPQQGTPIGNRLGVGTFVCKEVYTRELHGSLLLPQALAAALLLRHKCLALDHVNVKTAVFAAGFQEALTDPRVHAAGLPDVVDPSAGLPV